MAGPLLVIALVLLAAVPKGASGRPWNVTFGGCVFTGDTDGAPLVRQGSCPDQVFTNVFNENKYGQMGRGMLDLSHKNITVVPGTAFRGMTRLNFLDLSHNQITDLPAGVFACLPSLMYLLISNNEFHFRDEAQPPPSAITDQEAQCYLNRYPILQAALAQDVETDKIYMIERPDIGNGAYQQFDFLAIPDKRAKMIDAAKTHWMQYGKNEERIWSCPGPYPLLPAAIFSSLSSLTCLIMANNAFSVPLPDSIFVGLNLTIFDINDNMLSCVPLTNEQRDGIEYFYGPITCELLKKRENGIIGGILGCILLFCLGIWLWFRSRRRRAYKARFKTLDKNHDGFISEKDFVRGWSTTSTAHLKWKDVGSEKPSTGTEIKNEPLAAALQEKVEFKEEEWDQFDLADLSADSYIKAGNHYFTQAENIGYISEDSEFAQGWLPTPSPQEDSIPTQDVMHLQWKDVGAEKPSTGTEIKNELLAATLQEKVEFKKEEIKNELFAAAVKEKVEFKKEEWGKFHLANLSGNSYIKAGDSYFKPAESIVWKDEKWVDEQTGNPSNKKGKSSKDSKKSSWNKDSKNLYSKKSHYPLKNFPFKWLDKDNKGKISRKEYEDGFELVEAFLQFEAGICLPLCLLLRAKYLDEKDKLKQNTNIVGDVTGQQRVSHPGPLPGTPSPAEIPAEIAPSHLRALFDPQPSSTPKCDIETLKMGCSAVAAQGLRSAVGLDDDEVFANMMQDPEIAIECEILVAGLGGHVNGCIDDIDNYYSIKFGQSWREEEEWKDEENEIVMDEKNGKAPIPQHVKNSAKRGKYHGGDDFKKEDYDTGNKGKKLKDFHNDPASVLAGLLIWEVLILRLYTSTTYRLFNGPMRSLLSKDGQKSQHPLRFTIYALTEGVKKLRAVEARDDEKGFNTPKVLWRGMTNKELGETFFSVGGTEMAVMSTTSELKVAQKYAESEFPLVFKFNTVGLTRGVKIQFLSLYPKEVEFIYPPLTFLSVVPNTKPYKKGIFTYVDVTPQMS
jgi:Ca2+-binding EF-hand superfamily protein